MPIYTKTGDTGSTSLANGQRISKSSAVIDFVGDLDELNTSLGLAASLLSEIDDIDFSLEIGIIEDIQKDLFVVGAVASGANMQFNSKSEVDNIEKTIDDYERILPKLKHFILPGGTVAGAQLHCSRAYSRKIERKLVALKSDSVMVFLPYLNRLSDLLFVMGRYVNLKQKQGEVMWEG